MSTTPAPKRRPQPARDWSWLAAAPVTITVAYIALALGYVAIQLLLHYTLGTSLSGIKCYLVVGAILSLPLGLRLAQRPTSPGQAARFMLVWSIAAWLVELALSLLLFGDGRVSYWSFWHMLWNRSISFAASIVPATTGGALAAWATDRLSSDA